eukprot:gene11017-biopygen5279
MVGGRATRSAHPDHLWADRDKRTKSHCRHGGARGAVDLRENIVPYRIWDEEGRMSVSVQCGSVLPTGRRRPFNLHYNWLLKLGRDEVLLGNTGLVNTGLVNTGLRGGG